MRKNRFKNIDDSFFENLPFFLDDEESNLFRSPLSKKYFLFFYLILLIFFFSVVLKLISLQIIFGQENLEKAISNQVKQEKILAPRGIFYDANHKILVRNKLVYDLYIKNGETKGSLKNLLQKINKIIKIDIKSILNEIKTSPQKEIKIARSLSFQQYLILKNKFNREAGLKFKEVPLRDYLYPESLAHILGYVGMIDQTNWPVYQKKNYDLDDLVGKSGLEKVYEEVLRSQAGAKYTVINSQGEIIKELINKEPSSGNNLILTIDIDLQEKIYQILKERKEKLPAVVIALNPSNGEILSLVNYPSFNLNKFNRLSSKEYQALIKDSKKPLFNRAIAGVYPSGSTIKPVLGYAALEEKIITPQTKIYDGGKISVANQYNPNIVYNFWGWNHSGLGWMDIYSAIVKSSDIYFYTIGGGYGDFKGLGLEKIEQYLKKFGFGRKTGIDLEGEEEGLVPTAEWKKKNIGEDWYIGDTYHISIGQGYFQTTPLQLINAISVIANEGKLFKPHLVKMIVDANGKKIRKIEPEIIERDFNSRNIAIIRQAMRQMVERGFANSFFESLSVKVAGKTGTAEYGPNNQYQHSWFVCFAPYEKPTIALVVLIEGGGSGVNAAKLAYQILNYYFKK